MLLCTPPPCALWWQFRLEFRNQSYLAVCSSTHCERAPRLNRSSLPLPDLSLKHACQKVLEDFSLWKVAVGNTEHSNNKLEEENPPWIEKLRVGQLTGWDDLRESLKRKTAPLLSQVPHNQPPHEWGTVLINYNCIKWVICSLQPFHWMLYIEKY